MQFSKSLNINLKMMILFFSSDLSKEISLGIKVKKIYQKNPQNRLKSSLRLHIKKRVKKNFQKRILNYQIIDRLI